MWFQWEWLAIPILPECEEESPTAEMMNWYKFVKLNLPMMPCIVLNLLRKKKPEKKKYLRNTARNTTAPPTRKMLLPIPPSSSSLERWKSIFWILSFTFILIFWHLPTFTFSQIFFKKTIDNSLFRLLSNDVEFEKNRSNLVPEKSCFTFLPHFSSVFNFCQKSSCAKKCGVKLSHHRNMRQVIPPLQCDYIPYFTPLPLFVGFK